MKLSTLSMIKPWPKAPAPACPLPKDVGNKPGKGFGPKDGLTLGGKLADQFRGIQDPRAIHKPAMPTTLDELLKHVTDMPDPRM